MSVLQAPVTKQERLYRVNKHCAFLKSYHGIAHKFALPMAHRQIPSKHKEEKDRGNDWCIVNLTYLENGVEKQLLCFIRGSANGQMILHDVKADQKIFVWKNAIKKMDLLPMSNITELTRQYECVEELVLGKTAVMYDVMRKYKQER